MTNDLGAATYSLTVAMMPPGDQEMMTKATASSRRVGQLANHHRANNDIMTSIVASHHAMPRCGHKTKTITMLERMMMPVDGH